MLLPLLDAERIQELESHVRHQIMQTEDHELIPLYMRQLDSLSLGKAIPAQASAPIVTAAAAIKFPALANKISVLQKLDTIQSYIESLQYNFLADPFWIVKKSYSVYRLHRMAQEMISNCLPIRCLEAVVLGMYLTCGLNCERITMSFKSRCEGVIYRHIVLVIKLGDKWGALGLSRRSDLQGKPFSYRSLSALIEDYRDSYTKNYHTLLKVKIGLPITHDRVSNETVIWKNTKFSIQDEPWILLSKEIDVYARSALKNVK